MVGLPEKYETWFERVRKRKDRDELERLASGFIGRWVEVDVEEFKKFCKGTEQQPTCFTLDQLVRPWAPGLPVWRQSAQQGRCSRYRTGEKPSPHRFWSWPSGVSQAIALDILAVVAGAVAKALDISGTPLAL